MANDLKVGIKIDASVRNFEKIEAISETLTGVAQQTAALQNQTEKLRSEWEKLTPEQHAQQITALESAIDGLGKQTAGAVLQSDEMAHSFEHVSEKAQQLQAIAKTKTQLGIDTDERAVAQIEQAVDAYSDLKKEGGSAQKELSHAADVHRRKIEELEQSLRNVKPSLGDIAGGLTKIVGGAGGLAVVAQSAMSFETAMAGVKKVVDATPEQMQQLSGTIRQLAYELGMTAEETANITAMGGQLGVAFQDLPEFTRLAGEMAVAFNMTAEQAGDAAAKLANVYQIPLANVRALGDAINTLGNNTAATEAEIIQATLRIGGTAKQFGLTAEAAAALADSFIALGKPPEVAATAINALLSKLQTAPAAGEEFKNALASIGLEANALAQSISANPEQALMSFMEKLSQLDKQQRAITLTKLFGLEYADDIALAAGSLDSFRHALSLVADQQATAGAMQEETNAAMDTAAKKIEQAKTAINNIAIELGSLLLPIIADVASAFGGTVKEILALAQAHPHITELVSAVSGIKVVAYAAAESFKLLGGVAQNSFSLLGAGSEQASAGLHRLRGETEQGVEGFSKMDKAANALSKTLNVLSAATAGFTTGFSFGSWLYEQSEHVRAFGDSLGKLAAYTVAIFSDSTFEDVATYYKTSAQVATEETQRLAQAKEQLAQKAAEAAEAERQHAEMVAQNQAQINQLVAEIEQHQSSLQVLREAGEAGGATYAYISSQIETAKQKIHELTEAIEGKPIGLIMKTEFEAADKAFKTLGLSLSELETGISDKAKQSLEAFGTVAVVAEGNVTQLARAYEAARQNMGSSSAAQEQLNQKLLDAVGGNQELYQAVIQTAQAQNIAKRAADEQSAALQALGLNMEDIANRTSSGVQKMLAHWKTGMEALKASGKQSAEAVRLAFDNMLKSLHTTEDFKAFSDALKETGTAGALTAEQLAQLRAGINGGANAAQAAAQANAAHTQSLSANTSEVLANKAAIEQKTQALKESANAAKEASTAEAKVESQSEKTRKTITLAAPAYYTEARKRIEAMRELGATSEEVENALQSFWQKTRFNFGVSNVNEVATSLVSAMKAAASARARIDEMTESLRNGSFSAQDISEAMGKLHISSLDSVDSVQNLGDSRLNNLRDALKEARNHMRALSEEARDTADSLEADLARLRGDDSLAKQIEETKKLKELEAKRAAAQKAGNKEAAKEFERALILQKQIFAEEQRQAEVRAAEAQKKAAERQAADAQRKQNKAEHIAQNRTPDNRMADDARTPQVDMNKPAVTLVGSAPTAEALADIWNAKIAAAEERGAQRGKEEFAKELYNAAKRRPL